MWYDSKMVKVEEKKGLWEQKLKIWKTGEEVIYIEEKEEKEERGKEAQEEGHVHDHVCSLAFQRQRLQSKLYVCQARS